MEAGCAETQYYSNVSKEMDARSSEFNRMMKRLDDPNIRETAREDIRGRILALESEIEALQARFDEKIPNRP